MWGTLRTLMRLSDKELQMNLTEWKNKWQLMKAIEHLAKGESALEAALNAGFQSTSGLNKLFKKTLGSSPKKYFSNTRY